MWRSKKGDQSFEAEYVRDASGKVWLKPAKGKTRVVPISALSEADQTYIYCLKPPKIEIDVDDDISRGTDGGDIDDIIEEIQCTITITKTSRNPYPKKYKAYYFLLAFDIKYKRYILVEKEVESFELNHAGDSFSIKGRQHMFERDPDPPWGRKYDGYFVCVKDEDGKMLAMDGEEKYLSQFTALVKGNLNVTQFDKNFTLIED